MKEFIEKLIGRLEEKKDQYTDDCFVHKMMATEEAIKIVNQLADEYKHCTLCYLQSPCEYQNENAILPVSEFTEDNGWIACSERLPEEKGDYLVTCNDGKVRVWWFVVEEDFKCWLRGVYELKPIAWQPLPPKFEPKGE